MADQTQRFFDGLPRDTLSKEEEDLRHFLLEAAAASLRVLPKSGAVSLQQWVERRIPGDISLKTDKAGSVRLRAVAQSDKSANPQVEKVNSEEFLSSLPEQELGPEELRLRETVLEALSRGAASVRNLVNEGQVKLAKTFLPRGVMLEDWIDRRIGAEVTVYKGRGKGEGKGGESMCKLVPPKMDKEERVSQVEAFFEDLPEDSFTEAEIHLRNTILDVLATKGGSAILSFIGADKGVGAARRACLFSGVSLKEWIMRRIANEVAVEDASNGQFNVRVLEVDPAGSSAAGRHQSEEQNVDGMEEERMRDQQDKSAKRDAFFAGLSEDNLSADEHDLLESLLEFLENWKGDTPPTLSHAGVDGNVNAHRAHFLPKGVSLRDWIDKRVGMEIELVRPGDESSEVFIGKRGAIDHDALERGIQRLKVNKRARARGPRSDRGKSGHDAKGGGSRGSAPPGRSKSDGKGRVLAEAFPRSSANRGPGSFGSRDRGSRGSRGGKGKGKGRPDRAPSPPGKRRRL